MKTKTKNIFPRIKTKSGGYTTKVRFTDEERGERYFDTEWGVSSFQDPGQFTITCAVDYQGYINGNNPSGPTLGRDIKVGNIITLYPTRWSMRGRNPMQPIMITISKVTLLEGVTVINYVPLNKE